MCVCDDTPIVCCLSHPLYAVCFACVAHRIASSIRDPAYDLRQYHADVQEAFPELRLYFVEPPEKSGKKTTKRGALSSELTTSGIDGESEYLRTVGAFFAVYWLMRIGIDGERGT